MTWDVAQDRTHVLTDDDGNTRAVVTPVYRIKLFMPDGTSFAVLERQDLDAARAEAERYWTAAEVFEAGGDE